MPSPSVSTLFFAFKKLIFLPSIDKLYDDQTIIDLSMKMADLGDAWLISI